MRVAFLDFDDTLCDANSDPHLLNDLDHEVHDMLMKMIDEGVNWTIAMDQIYSELRRRNFSTEDIRQGVSRLPLSPYLYNFLSALNANGFQIFMVSDANNFLIEQSLRSIDAWKFITKCYSNPIKIEPETDILSVKWLFSNDSEFPNAHTCPSCPPSMCKFDIVQKIIRDLEAHGTPVSTAVYCGDGLNDACGIRGCPIDKTFACVRDGFALSQVIDKELPIDNLRKTFLWDTLDNVTDMLSHENVLSAATPTTTTSTQNTPFSNNFTVPTSMKLNVPNHQPSSSICSTSPSLSSPSYPLQHQFTHKNHHSCSSNVSLESMKHDSRVVIDQVAKFKQQQQMKNSSV